MIDTVGLKREHVRKLIRASLERCEAVNLERLAEWIGADRNLVSREIKTLVQLGEVEVLRPLVGKKERRGPEQQGPAEHYRLIRRTDSDFLWEQEIIVRLPASRMSDVRQQHERSSLSAARRDSSRWWGRGIQTAEVLS